MTLRQIKIFNGVNKSLRRSARVGELNSIFLIITISENWTGPGFMKSSSSLP